MGQNKNQTLHKKWSFKLRVSSVNVTKSAGNWGFGHIYWRNLNGKPHFFEQWNLQDNELIPTGTPRRIHVDSTWILRRYVEEQISTNFHVISTYFFDVISMVEKSTWFPRTFFDIISLFEKFTWFSRTFFDVISMVKKSTWFHVLFSM